MFANAPPSAYDRFLLYTKLRLSTASSLNYISEEIGCIKTDDAGYDGNRSFPLLEENSIHRFKCKDAQFLKKEKV